MKNKYILVLGLLQLLAVTYSVLITYAVQKAVAKTPFGDGSYPLPRGFLQATTFGKYGFILYIVVILWVFLASLYEAGHLRAQLPSALIASSGFLLFVVFGLLGIYFTRMAWTPFVTLGVG